MDIAASYTFVRGQIIFVQFGYIIILEDLNFVFYGLVRTASSLIKKKKKKKKSGLCPKQLGRTRISDWGSTYIHGICRRREMMKLPGFPMEEGKHLNSSLKDEPNSAGYSVETASYELYLYIYMECCNKRDHLSNLNEEFFLLYAIN